MRDVVVTEALAGEEAYVVGGALRDELLGRPVLDLDVVCADPEAAARKLARATGGSPFPLSAEHGGWRVVLDGEAPVGTPVVLVGHGLLMESHARVAGTITYELACGIESSPLRARRTVVDA